MIPRRESAESASEVAALGPEPPEGVLDSTSRGAEGEGREDEVLSALAAEGFMNNAG